jgi:hypothetical protein
MSTVCGRAYNTETGAGLNQYILSFAPTGSGKDNINRAINVLLNLLPPAKGDNGRSSNDFRGAGFIASGPALIKRMSRDPCVLFTLGEIHKLIAEWENPRNINGQGIKRLLLELYNRSGDGNYLDPLIYSDNEKSVAAIRSPSVTLFGEGTPEGFLEGVTLEQISGGFLPRCTTFCYDGKRPYSNTHIVPFPDWELAAYVKNLMAHCRDLITRDVVQIVPSTEEARYLLADFDDETTDLINCSKEVGKQLWNRAHLKALKLASIAAISQNFRDPVIGVGEALWAISLTRCRTDWLAGKIASNDFGQSDGDENKQLEEIKKFIFEYCETRDYSRYAKYYGTAKMHEDWVIPMPLIMQRLRGVATFRNDRRLGPSKAIERGVKLLLDGDQLRELPKSQTQAQYGCCPRAFIISHPETFIEAGVQM